MTKPTEAFTAIILNLLTPLLLAGANNDLTLACLAAQQAIEAYQAANPAQLISIAQIVAFAIASLDTLRLSMDATLSPSMTLKQRSNANALSRSSQRAADTLAKQRQYPADTPPNDTPSQTETLAALKTVHARVQAAPTPEPRPEQQRNQAWAAAMTTVAAEYAAELDTLPLAQRRVSLIRIGALTDSAHALSRTESPRRATLLNTTTLAPPPKT